MNRVLFLIFTMNNKKTEPIPKYMRLWQAVLGKYVTGTHILRARLRVLQYYCMTMWKIWSSK